MQDPQTQRRLLGRDQLHVHGQPDLHFDRGLRHLRPHGSGKERFDGRENIRLRLAVQHAPDSAHAFSDGHQRNDSALRFD